MVFGEARSRLYQVAGEDKQLEEYLLVPRAKHFMSPHISAMTLRVSTRFNTEGRGTHFYFHSTDAPVHFALHLDRNREEDMPLNSFHFTFDDVSMKSAFQRETGHPWCLQIPLIEDNSGKLAYQSHTLEIIEQVYMPFLEGEFALSENSTYSHGIQVFLDAFLDIMNGLYAVYNRGNLLGSATLIPAYNRAIEFLYSQRAIGGRHFIKLNNEGLKE